MFSVSLTGRNGLPYRADEGLCFHFSHFSHKTKSTDASSSPAACLQSYLY